MRLEKINLAEKFSRFSEHWSPKIIGELNDHYVKIAKVQGEFVWHSHADEDELFLVVKGRLLIRLRDQEIELAAGEIFIVPRGVEHQTAAIEEAEILLFEPKKISRLGNAKLEPADDQLEWI